jgi:cytochrome c oxidase subunit 3
VSGIIVHAHGGGNWLLYLGAAAILACMFFWWRDVLKESRTPGLHTAGGPPGPALRHDPVHRLGGDVLRGLLLGLFPLRPLSDHVSGAATAIWPPAGIKTFDPFHLPFLNTMILLLSGCTVTWAHPRAHQRDRRGLVAGLALTVGLGMTFTALQAWEYAVAPFAFNGGGVYSSTFFLATGFHGFHVIVGTIFLAVCLVRAIREQFTPERHFGFEAAALVLALRGRGVAVPLRVHLLVGRGRDRASLVPPSGARRGHWPLGFAPRT